LKDRKTAAPKNNYFCFPLFFSKIALMQKINNYERCRGQEKFLQKYFSEKYAVIKTQKKKGTLKGNRA
jgi:hypothetical protein